MPTGTADAAFSLGTSASTRAAWRVEQLAALDQRLCVGPYVLIDAENSSPRRVATRAEADAAVHAGSAVAGQLRSPVLAADIDPADAGAEDEAGEAVVDDLVLWAEAHGLPWLVRASGRPGGRHVIVATAAASIAAELTPAWRRLCAELGRQHGVPTSPRQVLRLLSSPHRQGLDAPVLGGTLTLEDLPESQPESRSAESAAVRPRRRRTRRSGTQSGVDRSAREYGDALARARAGWSARAAWAAANVAGAKAAEQGERGWRRWVWAPAVTVVDAEAGCTEDDAWLRFQHASSRRARQLGRDGWCSTYWQPALVEARQQRPRRRRTGSTPAQHAHTSSEDVAEVAAVRAGLLAAAERALDACRRRPQFRRSVRAVLGALAPVLVRRGGSIAQRPWAESARVSRSTLRTVLPWLHEHDVLSCTRSYQDGADDSDTWQPGSAATADIEHARKTRPTRGVHPTTRSHGRADTTRMARRHDRERREFRFRQELSAATKSSEQAYKTSNHPAAKALRSLWFQKRWWQNQPTEQQEHRRIQRRERLTALHRSDRATWLSWLEHRDDLVFAAARADAGQASADDHAQLEQTPRVLHRGLADPAWRMWDQPARSAERRVATAPPKQLQLLAARRPSKKSTW